MSRQSNRTIHLFLVGMAIAGLGLAGCRTDFVIRDYNPLPRLNVTKGLSDFQVIQREGDSGTISFEGTTDTDGEIWARISNEGERSAPRNRDWRSVGRVVDHQWRATIGKVPVGGPYQVSVQLRDSTNRPLSGTNAHRLLVGDLWILAGQSNMQGVGDMVNVEKPSLEVHTFESRYQWAIAEDPLHRLLESPNAVHHLIVNPKATPADIEKNRNAPRQPATKGTGLGIPFAKELYARTKVPIGLVPCAHGGTSMDQWDPARKGEGGKSLYGSMLDRFHAVGGKVKGVLWYQGESDANADRQPGYHDKMVRLIAAIRDDFGDPSLPFYMVQLGRVVAPKWDELRWSAIREDERKLGEEIAGVVTVPAVDLELDDLIHIGTQGHKRLGRRLAIVADYELFGHKAVTTGSHFKSAVVESPKGSVIRVRFEGVNGRLKPDAHIGGFSLRAANGDVVGEFFDVMVDPKQPDNVICQSQQPIPDGANLWYGYGVNPYCNLVDEQDMAAPTFGPIALTPPATQKDK